MENTEREFRALLESSQNDPNYYAQKLALDISLRISQRLKTLRYDTEGPCCPD